ncbi:AraC family transcriptional regulator [Sphingosinicella terrae]|uniref:AraC family transcriptional regulator n=1 Tax=Sphingosinicella terrae TaxID=2172047 RepID=UPI000E0D22EA|nr:AraC family transcriptional regulator [Sphingosinicella terrae]
MIDPLAQVVELLRPSAAFSKVTLGKGPWLVSRSEEGQPFYCLVMEGRVRLSVPPHEAIILEPGDFALIPSAYDFAVSSGLADIEEAAETMPVQLRPGLYRLGCQDGEPDTRMVVGYCAFGSADAALLVSLMPQLVHIPGEARLSTLVQLIDEESRGDRPARDAVLARLIEVLLIEAFRSTTGSKAPSGLVRGLADPRLAVALRHIHARPTHPWTVVELAREAGLSRSIFFDRFRRAVGLSPIEYLVHWRMALAKGLLRDGQVGSVAEVAERVGYSSASTFSVAFTRTVGVPPSAYGRGAAAAPV